MATHSSDIFKVVGVFGAASLLAITGLSGCTQKGVSCQTAAGDFAVKLMKKSGDDACVSPGGVYGVHTYFYAGSDGRPNLNDGNMAIQSEDLGVVVEEAEGRLGDLPDPSNPTFAKGDFQSSSPDSEDLCHIPTLEPAIQNIPVLPMIPAVEDDPETEEDESEPEVPEAPAQSFRYEWSNLRFLVTAAATGTQFVGDLKVTQNGCTVEYEAWGLYPAVYCEDADGNPDDKLCASEANPAEGLVLGSGINPDYRTVCDPVLLLCMLTDRPPTL